MGIPKSFFFWKVVPTSDWQFYNCLVTLVGVMAVPPGRAIPNRVRDLHHLDACGSFFSGHSGFSSAIIQLGFLAFTEWIGILSSEVSGRGHGPRADPCVLVAGCRNSHGS